MINKIELRDFKKVSIFETNLSKINILVGANNSGKSSVLQGIHFSILAEAVRRKLQRDTVAQDQLLYVPSADFSVLRHDAPYSNYSGNTSVLGLTGDTYSDGVNPDAFSITISKGRNYGNISIHTQGSNPFRQIVTSYLDLYSIYVPGLSGIPLEEKLQTKAVIRSATANGDANLYLRNILYYIKEKGEIDKLNSWIERILPNTSVQLPYNPEMDLNIIAQIKTGDSALPIELSGTGFLQITQIMAYALLFKPKLLLLDEPDEHLHPNNQVLLSEALKMLSHELDLQIILSTHSRHMLSAFDDDANFIWMQNGRVYQTDASSYSYEVLMDIGALDTFDKVLEGKYLCVVLTEDNKKRSMRKLLEYNGFSMTETLIFSYKGCGNIEVAIQLADFIHKSAPNCRIIIHRDRDFMTSKEVEAMETRIASRNVKPFITDGSDIEAYFLNPNHLAQLLEVTCDEISQWLDEIANNNHVEFQQKFSNKRQEIKNSFLYRNNRDECPEFLSLFGTDVPTRSENRLGKLMLKKINSNMSCKYGRSVDLIQKTEHLYVNKLNCLLTWVQSSS